jgi:hypothetical protein
MKKKPSDELIGREIHDLLAVIVGIITPSEGNPAVEIGKDAIIADRDAVGIPAEVLEDTFGAAERCFAVDDPLFMIELVAERMKRFWCLEMTCSPGEHQRALFEAMFEVVEKLTSEQCRHDRYGKKETPPARYPTIAVRG